MSVEGLDVVDQYLWDATESQGRSTRVRRSGERRTNNSVREREGGGGGRCVCLLMLWYCTGDSEEHISSHFACSSFIVRRSNLPYNLPSVRPCCSTLLWSPPPLPFGERDQRRVAYPCLKARKARCLRNTEVRAMQRKQG